MRIPDNPQAGGSGPTPDAGSGKPRTRFSDVLRDEKQRPGESLTSEGEERKAPDGMAGAAAFAPPRFLDIAPPNSGSAVERPEALVTSVVQEIAVEAPPHSDSTVDIQFDSRTLEGLRVRVRKAGDSVEVRFSTSSEAVSRLLADNVQSLTEALAQRGYPAPAVSVQRTPGSSASSASGPQRGDRDGGSRGRHDRGSGRQRR